jgi:hypothetical protein
MRLTTECTPTDDPSLTCLFCWQPGCTHEFRFKHQKGSIRTIGVHETCADAQSKGEWAKHPPKPIYEVSPIDTLEVPGRGTVILVQDDDDKPYASGMKVRTSGKVWLVRGVERQGNRPHVGLVVREIEE